METWPRITAMYDDLVYFYIHLEQFHPKWSKIQFDEHIFQIGASNHQLVEVYTVDEIDVGSTPPSRIPLANEGLAWDSQS